MVKVITLIVSRIQTEGDSPFHVTIHSQLIYFIIGGNNSPNIKSTIMFNAFV